MPTPHLLKAYWASIVGTSSDVDDINSRLVRAQQRGHVLSPALSIGALPAGFGVNFSMVKVNWRETYEIEPDKYMLTKLMLTRFAANLGISWEARDSFRTDNRQHPWYCTFKATGSYRAFDGSLQTLLGDSEVDLRDGTVAAEKLRKDGSRLAFSRQHIQAQAQTSAQLRAIRSLGIQATYTQHELRHPFVFVRLFFTGATTDPQLSRDFAAMNAQNFLTGRSALYSKPQPKVIEQQKPAFPTLPDGRNLPLNKSAVDDLTYWRDRLEREMAVCGRSEADTRLVDAINDELHARTARQQTQQENY